MIQQSRTGKSEAKWRLWVIGIHVNGTHKCCIGTDSKSTT